MNMSAIDNKPPLSWRTSKVVPLFKNKGLESDPTNYRSIAITPPFTKAFMAVINKRVTDYADKHQLHAPTQAGFRAHHSTVEQAMII